MTDNQNFEDDDDFYDEDERLPVNRWKIVGGALAVVIVAGFGIGIWYAYDQGVKKGVQLAPPIIKADSTPVKQQPEESGGMEIAHQDKKVFDVLKADKGEEKVEKLMTPPEAATQEPAPVDITETVRKDDTAETNKAGAETLMTKPAAEVAEATKDVAPAAEEAKKDIVEKVEAVPAKKPTVAALPVKPKAEKAVAVAPKAATGNYRVQLGAFRSTDAAEKAWVDLQKAHEDLLGTIEHRVQSVEIKGKGMFHRLQAGAFAEKVGASALCSSLKAEKQDCLVATN